MAWYGFLLIGVIIGLIGGTFIGVKWLAEEGTEVKVGKLVIRGKGHTVTDMLDVDVDKPLTMREIRRAYRKAKRKAKAEERIINNE